MPANPDTMPGLSLPVSPPSRANVGRALRRRFALLLFTLSVVMIPNVVSFAASILD